MKHLLSTVLILMLSLGVFAGVDDDIDYVAIAKVLIKDGFVDRAETTLNKINLDQDDVELGQYWFVKGIILLHRKKYESAIKNLKNALKDTGEKEIHLYLSEAYFNKKNYIQALQHVNISGLKTPAYFVLKSSILWELKEREKSWQVLNKAKKHNVDHRIVYKKQFSLLLDQSLFHAAQEFVIKHIGELIEEDIVAIANNFREKKHYYEAIKILEVAKLRWPFHEKINMELALNYIKLKNRYSAALIIEELARVHKNLSHEASELLRGSGQTYRVGFLNQYTEDPSKRLKQKLAIYLETEKYGLVARMAPLLQENHLLNQEDIRYAVAYSFYKMGEFNKSNFHLNRLSRNDLFEKAAELRSEMEKCQQNRWLCRAIL